MYGHQHLQYEIRFLANTSGHSTDYEPWVDYWLTTIARTTSFITEIYATHKHNLHMHIYVWDIRYAYHQSPGWQEVWPRPSAFEWDDCSHQATSACCHNHSHPSHTGHSVHLHKQSCPTMYKNVVQAYNIPNNYVCGYQTTRSCTCIYGSSTSG